VPPYFLSILVIFSCTLEDISGGFSSRDVSHEHSSHFPQLFQCQALHARWSLKCCHCRGIINHFSWPELRKHFPPSETLQKDSTVAVIRCYKDTSIMTDNGCKGLKNS